MKNLAIKSIDANKFPFRQSRKESLTFEYGDMYNIDRFDDGCNSDKHPINYNNVLAKRIIRKYINKPFDEAYAHYCKKAKDYGKEIFKDFFNKNTYAHKSPSCYVDEEGYIRKVNTNKTNAVYQIYSWNYKQRWELNPITNEREKVIVSGEVFTFKHKNHLYYKELYKQRALKRKAKREGQNNI